MASFLHRDHLASVRIITNAAGQPEQGTTYTPYGDPDTTQLIISNIPNTPEEHSFIGERFDASTGLLYLNARYYDPALGRFMQPDWWEVHQKGVGTNRYAYSFDDPVNLSDRIGHNAETVGTAAGIACAIVEPCGAIVVAGATIAGAAVTGYVIGKKLGEWIFGSKQTDYEDPGESLGGNDHNYPKPPTPPDGPNPTGAVLTGIGIATLDNLGSDSRGGPQIINQDGDVFEYSMAGANGSEITVITSQIIEGNSLILNGLHIDGAGAGSSSLRELRQFARDLGRQHGVEQVVIRGGVRTTGANPGHKPRDITIRVNQ